MLPGMINVIVHIIMYSYFFLATFGEPVKKYLWWKRYLTKIQLVCTHLTALDYLSFKQEHKED